MTLAEHLRELRRRLIVAAVAIIIGTAVAFVFRTHVLHVVTGPYCSLPAKYRFIHDRCTLVVSGVLDPFTVTLRLSLYAGLLLSSPVWLWQVWRFITPGLYRNERKWALAFVGSSVVLFGAGTVVAYVTMKNGLRFLLSFATGDLASLLTFPNYLSYFVAMVLVFSLSFEFPIAVVMLNLAGVLSAARLRRWGRGIIFGIFVFAAVATPSQDPITMLGLALPMVLLFGIAYAIAAAHDRRVARRGDTSPYAHLADDELSPIDDDEPVGTPE
jgi:sec-independent protein translocase protein TatC